MTLRYTALSLGVIVYLSFLGCVPAQDGAGSGNTASSADQAQPDTSKSGEPVGKRTAKSAPAKGKTAKADAAKGKKEPDAAADEKLEKATFGGGCFWCLEAVFERIPGVRSVVSGYAGGTVPRPSYELVSTGMTGHAEVVQITYDPRLVTYDKLLDTFWEFHDPTTPNRQGPDEGTQYRSIILFHSEEQKQAALKSYHRLVEGQAFAAPIVTQLVPLSKFYPAEKYHQDYYRRHRNDDYCQMYIVPKLIKLKSKAESGAQH